VKTEVFVGGQSATVSYAGRAPGFPGTDQINFVVPNNAPLGCWVPVYRTAGVNISNFVTMAVQTNGGTCSDTVNPLGNAIVSGGRMGMFVALRATVRQDVGVVAHIDFNTDLAGYGFYLLPAAPFGFNPAASLPPQGTCSMYTGSGDLLGGQMPYGLVPSDGRR
jgi:hypothetical protein